MERIAILMSTFNGERYIDEQIESIINQKFVSVDIWIRDDGSTDGTKEKIFSWVKKYPKKVNVFCGENIGFRRSFLRLTEIVPSGYDYYGFSDQDDVWSEEKCIKAIEKLRTVETNVKLYTSNLDIVNEKLKHIYKTSISQKYNIDLYSYWIRARFAGCTFVFSEALKNMVSLYANYSNEYIEDHDFLTATLAFLYGEVVFDENSYIKHRRCNTSVTSGGRGIRNRLKTEFCTIFNSKNRRYFLAKEFVKNQENIPAEYRSFFMKISRYQRSIIGKFQLIFDKRFKSGKILFDVLTKFSVLVSKY